LRDVHIQEAMSRLLLMFSLSGHTRVATFLGAGSLFPHSPCLYFTAVAMHWYVPLSYINKLPVQSRDFKFLKAAIPGYRLYVDAKGHFSTGSALPFTYSVDTSFYSLDNSVTKSSSPQAQQYHQFWCGQPLLYCPLYSENQLGM
jgi:hypothetical protein